ncbi:MAG: hypothetical protein ABIJ08_04980 [Nanoarchaeota archaeon]
MSELNFCPYCNASHYKLMLCGNNVFFCKECNRFFVFEALQLKCPKCNKSNISKSDFPAPSGEAVFQCNLCKKGNTASEFLKYNKIK